jgi:hypothetical protein
MVSLTVLSWFVWTWLVTDVAADPWQAPAAVRSFVADRLPEGDADRVRLARLHHLLAAEVAKSRRADCVGFAFLFAGLAREAGMPVRFAVKKDVARLGTGGKNTPALEEGHMAVSLGGEDRGWVVDFSGVRKGAGEFEVISDRLASAILWSNRGAYAFLAGHCVGARIALRKAAAIFPDWHAISRNLATVERRCGAR